MEADGTRLRKATGLAWLHRALFRAPAHRWRRILPSPAGTVRILNVDKKEQKAKVAEHTTGDFLVLLADQVSDHYRHRARYFRLLAPRTKALHYFRFLRLLGHVRPPRARLCVLLKGGSPPRNNYQSTGEKHFPNQLERARVTEDLSYTCISDSFPPLPALDTWH